MIIAALLVAQAVAPAPATLTWNNITLAAPASTLRPVFGDPLRVVLFDNGARRIARYWLPGSTSTYALVIEERGYIIGLEAFTNVPPTGPIETVPPDFLGVRLGETLEDVRSKAPQLHSSTDDDGTPMLIGRVSETLGAGYSFQNGRAAIIHWSTKIRHGDSELPPLADPSGEDYSSAVLDMQKNETDGVSWEYRYLGFHPCADSTPWQLRKQALVQHDGRSYDVLHVACPPTKSERDFYFDITSYFGKGI